LARASRSAPDRNKGHGAKKEAHGAGFSESSAGRVVTSQTGSGPLSGFCAGQVKKARFTRCMTVSTSRPLPPVTVLSGFLGAGKTTLLLHLLAQAGSAGRPERGRRWAAVVNDLAGINIDAQRVAPTGAARTVALGNGCVCCTVRDELAETLAELGATGGFDHVLVEATGVADPRAVADLFVRNNAFGRNLSDFARLQSLVTVVDARAFLDTTARTGAVAAAPRRPKAGPDVSAAREAKPGFELMLDQVECADVLVLNKCDLVDAAALAELEAIVRGLNPRAEIMRVEHGRVSAEELLDRPRFEAGATLGAARWIRLLNGSARAPLTARTTAEQVTGGNRHGFTHFVYETRRPFARDRFFRWIEAGGLPPELLRAKGFFWLAEQPADMGFLSVAGGRARREFIGTWAAEMVARGVIAKEEVPAPARQRWREPWGDRRQELVFIGRALPETELRAALDGCLADEKT
jgi:G3E family GTPase